VTVHVPTELKANFTAKQNVYWVYHTFIKSSLAARYVSHSLWTTAAQEQSIWMSQFSCILCRCLLHTPNSNSLWEVFKPRKFSSSFSQFGYSLQRNTSLRTILCICKLFSFKPGTSWNVHLDLQSHFL